MGSWVGNIRLDQGALVVAFIHFSRTWKDGPDCSSSMGAFVARLDRFDVQTNRVTSDTVSRWETFAHTDINPTGRRVAKNPRPSGRVAVGEHSLVSKSRGGRVSIIAE